MLRISLKPAQSYPWYLRPFFWNQQRKYGAVLDSARLWARSPRLFLGVAFLYGMIDRKTSPHRSCFAVPRDGARITTKWLPFLC